MGIFRPPKNIMIFKTCLCNSKHNNELSVCYGELVSGIVEPCSKESKLTYSWFQRDLTTCLLDCCHLGCKRVMWHNGTGTLEEPAVSVFRLDVVPPVLGTCVLHYSVAS